MRHLVPTFESLLLASVLVIVWGLGESADRLDLTIYSFMWKRGWL